MSTGAELSQKAGSVAVPSTILAPMPSSSATVMQTIASGEKKKENEKRKEGVD